MTRPSFLPALGICLLTLLPGLVAPAGADTPIPTVILPSRPADCPNVQTADFSNGGHDGFTGGAATSPRAAFNARVGARTRRAFDEGGADKDFAHTLTGLPGRILAATLRIHIRSEHSLASNDGIGLQLLNAVPGTNAGSAFAWYGAIAPAAVASGSGAWTGVQGTDLVLSLDLASLPGAGKPNILGDLSTSGYLDVYVQDDTSVDYVDLHVTSCVCPVPFSTFVEQGTEDDFVGPEATTPRTALSLAYPGATRRYDEGGSNVGFATTLTLPGYDCLDFAFLEIRFKGESADASNDFLWLQYNEKSSLFHYGQPIPGASSAGLLGPQVVTIDLRQVGLLGDVALSGHLDVYVQDDTNVDYVRLGLTYG